MRNNKTTHTAPNVEQNSRNALHGEKEVERFTTRVDIHIHSKRKRLVDPDGISAKAVIDGLVLSGLLADDTPEEIRNVTYSQEKAKDEETIITVTEA